MNKKLCFLLITSIITTSLLTPVISAQQLTANTASTKTELVTIAKKTSSTKKEKIAYYRKKIAQLDAQIDILKESERNYAMSSEEYRNIVRKQINLLKKKKYYLLKIYDLN
ncbi:hypothetical protein [Paenibacillus sp. FSL H8-0283]|uniref:hypothetical protein n=1 Tax=Paenibacillus sp. FSL H8-0283 TaxID=2921383 RepID=UPI00324B095B